MEWFAHPGRLWLLAAVVPMAAWVARDDRWRRVLWHDLGQGGRPARGRGWWRVLAAALIVASLAQPRWGRAFDPLATTGRDLVVLVDVSRSMAAEDAIPDRLGVATASARSLLGAIAAEPGDRVAVVAFAGRGVVRCPLTFQVGAAIEALAALRVGEVRPGGTDLGAGLDAALGAFDQEDHAGGRTIVVFSDGEDLAEAAPSAAARARDAGVVVHAVAIGDPDQAHPIPAGPGGASLTYQGKPVATRRTDAPLDALARATGGAMARVGLMPADLGPLFHDRIGPIAGRLRETARPAPRSERFAGFALAALACTLVGSMPSRVGNRARRLLPAALALVAIGAAGGGRDDAPGLVGKGRADYEAGRYAEALAAFEGAARLDPSSAIPPYDAAATLFRMGRYPGAVAGYRLARERAGPGLRIKVDYALGNALLASGDVGGALAAYDDCLASTLPGPVPESVRRDAGLNRAYAASRRADRRPPDDGGEGDSPDRPRPRKSGGQGGEDRKAGGSKGERASEAAGGEADPSAPPGSRGRGGQGGGGKAPPEAGSPGARLDAALREARNARRLRPADAPDDRPAARDGRDW